MGVAGQIVQHVLRPAKRPLGIYHPFLAKECAQESAEGLLLRQCLARAKEDELVLTKGAPQSGDEFTAKDPAQHFHREKEVIGSADPLLMIGPQSAAGHHAMNVGMRAPTPTI